MRFRNRIILILLLIIFFGLYPLIEVNDTNVFYLRANRYGNCLLAGATLSLAGILLQNFSKNDLADPYLIGVAPASLLGQTLGLLLNRSSQDTSIIMATIVSLLFLTGILRKKTASNTNVILLGVSVGIICTTLNSLIVYVNTDVPLLSRVKLMTFSTFDSRIEWLIIIFVAFFSFSLVLDYFLRSRFLSISIDGARNIAINSQHTALNIFIMIIVCIFTSFVTVNFGLIGLVGFIVPNVLKRYTGLHYKMLYTSTFLLGGVTLTVSDEIGRLLFPPYGVPAGLICSLVGAPFLIHTLLSKTNSYK